MGDTAAVRRFGIVVLLALVGIAAFWSGEQTTEDTKADARREDPPARTEEIVRTRSAARIRGAVVVTPCSAAGRVVDAGGRGIAGALVLLRSRRAGEPSGATEAPITARTDGADDWSVPGLAPGRYVLSATAAGFLPGSRDDLSLQSGDANAGLDLTLTAGGHPLRGTVHDISGGPVEDAVVTIERRGEGNLISAGPPAIPAISDAEGRFEARVADGVYRVEAWHADYATDSEIADVDGGPRSVTLRLVAAASVEGTVRTNQDGRPVAGAIVGVGESFEPGAPAAVADERGRFRLTGLRSGPYALRAMAAGHASGEPERIELGIGEALTDVRPGGAAAGRRDRGRRGARRGRRRGRQRGAAARAGQHPPRADGDARGGPRGCARDDRDRGRTAGAVSAAQRRLHARAARPAAPGIVRSSAAKSRRRRR